MSLLKGVIMVEKERKKEQKKSWLLYSIFYTLMFSIRTTVSINCNVVIVINRRKNKKRK
jgi:heme/copper-type cytochrome/quinol oxidase subunit 2